MATGITLRVREHEHLHTYFSPQNLVCMGSSKKHYDGIKSNVIVQKFLKIKRNTNIYLCSLRHSFQSLEDGNK